MISKSSITGLVVFASVLAAVGTAARAEVIATAGSVCHSFSGAHALDIDNVLNGVRNNNASPRDVICSVPRSSGTGSAPTFYVDGQNAAGTCTSCTVVIYRYTGVMVASRWFNRCAPSSSSLTWGQDVAFPSGTPISGFDYVSVQCTLPGNGTGVLFGTTVIQL